MKVYSEIRDTDVHDQPQKDLMEEHWKWHGERAAQIHYLFVKTMLYCAKLFAFGLVDLKNYVII